MSYYKIPQNRRLSRAKGTIVNNFRVGTRRAARRRKLLIMRGLPPLGFSITANLQAEPPISILNLCQLEQLPGHVPQATRTPVNFLAAIPCRRRDSRKPLKEVLAPDDAGTHRL
jgi:hypothetical protein